MRIIRCTAESGHPGTALDGAWRSWSAGDERNVPSSTAATLVARHPQTFAVVDRVIRDSESSPSIPSGVLDGHWKALTSSLKGGKHDAYLGPLRNREAKGRARESVLKAIDERAREIAGGA